VLTRGFRDHIKRQLRFAHFIQNTAAFSSQTHAWITSQSSMKPYWSVLVISPTHKRTEGPAPVWGSEFTSKDATLHGGSIEAAATQNVKFWVLVPGGGGELPLFWNSRAHENLKFC